MATIDPYSTVAVPAWPLANGVIISGATVFFYKHADSLYAVTNWHVLAGRDTNSGQPLHPSAAVPESIRISLPLKDKLGHWEGHEISLEIDGQSCWLQHGDHGQDVDVAVLKLDSLPDKFCPPALPLPDEQVAMLVKPGMDVFILGFPMGMMRQASLPVWKRGSIASEPELPIDGDRPCFLVDTATREGMSGAPVLLRSYGLALIDGKAKPTHTGHFHTRFIGVYSGRIGADDDLAAQLGTVWHRRLIDEIIENGARGDFELR